MSLRDLGVESRTYRLPQDPLVADVLNPCFGAAYRVRGQFGYFTSSVLGQLAVGLSRFLARQDRPSPIEFIVSPWLSEADAVAVETAAVDPRRTMEEAIAAGVLRAPRTLELDKVEEHALRCFAWLLAEGLLELEIAFVPGGRFHDKTWEFSDEVYVRDRNRGDAIFVTGSANATRQALRTNSEKMSVFPTWSQGVAGHVAPLEQSFSDAFYGHGGPVLWPVSDALREQLIERWKSDQEPTEEDLQRAARRVGDLWLIADPIARIATPSTPTADGTPHIPEWLNWRKPPYEHQEQAIIAWEDGRQGVLEMATGAGKTWTSLIAATRAHHETSGPTLLVIGVPFTPLLHQWADDCRHFGLEPVLPTVDSSGRSAKFVQIDGLVQDLSLGVRQFACVLATHHLIGDPEFGALVDDAKSLGVRTMLIGDEAHRLGAERFVASPPAGFEHRLGLSATPVRQYDDQGTEGLFEYFGEIVYQFGLDRAIGSCLVEYDYFVEPVRLSWDEVEFFLELSRKVAAAYRPNVTFKENRAYAAAVRERRAFLDTASGKLPALAAALERYGPNPLQHTLIYSSARESRQIGEVQQLLAQCGVANARITYQETPDLRKVRETIEGFRSGEIAVLVAMKVLDEGFNIPEIGTAFLLSSTGTEREWTQRRGRVLRMAPGKSKATIVDFLVLPPEDAERPPSVVRYLEGELKRVEAFARHSANKFDVEGGYAVIGDLLMEQLGDGR